MTDAPASAKALAVARPIPPPAPVTSATFPCKRGKIVGSLSLFACPARRGTHLYGCAVALHRLGSEPSGARSSGGRTVWRSRRPETDGPRAARRDRPFERPEGPPRAQTERHGQGHGACEAGPQGDAASPGEGDAAGQHRRPDSESRGGPGGLALEGPRAVFGAGSGNFGQCHLLSARALGHAGWKHPPPPPPRARGGGVGCV